MPAHALCWGSECLDHIKTSWRSGSSSEHPLFTDEETKSLFILIHSGARELGTQNQ